jgi:predicted ATPase
MFRKLTIENFKSIEQLELELGRVTVLIGANGSGKSNILEAIALASASAANKLDNEFLVSRGVRTTLPKFMRAAFPAEGIRHDINLSLVDADDTLSFRLVAKKTHSGSRWSRTFESNQAAFMLEKLKSGVDAAMWPKVVHEFREVVRSHVLKSSALPGFLIYSPENSALRTFQDEGQILPLGIKGEGLFAHLDALTDEEDGPTLAWIAESLRLIEWFEDFKIPEDLGPGERSIHVRDRYLAEGALFDQRSANEGFLFLLFYFTLFLSPDTPRFFAIDNIDASLNPKLCNALIAQVVGLAKEKDRQAIFTTHNPAVLDGLDLHDDEQRLFVVERSKQGQTRVRRVEPPKQLAGRPPVSLSEAFMRGYIGGLPKNF